MKKMNSLLLSVCVCALLSSGCDQIRKVDGFTHENSEFVFKTTTFQDPETLAQIGDQKFTKSQILDKSVVLKDLEQQTQLAILGLGFLKLFQMLPPNQKLPPIEVFANDPKTPLDKILNRFNLQPTEKIQVVYKGENSSPVLIKAKDIEITKEELFLNHPVMQSLEQRKFDEIVSQFSGQLARILINEQAMKQGIELQKYLEEVVLKSASLEISNEEVYSYMDKIGVSRPEVTSDLYEKMRTSLATRKQQALMEKYVSTQIVKGPIPVSFSPPGLKIKLDESWQPIAGYTDAPVSIVVFGSPVCPDCVNLVAHLKNVFQTYDGHLKLNWIYSYPQNDGVAEMISRGALCSESVKKNSSLKFLSEFSSKANQTDEAQFTEWAGHLGASKENFKTCSSSELSKDLLKKHQTYSNSIGIIANPTLWINGQTVYGMITQENLKDLVERAIKESGSSVWRAFLRRWKAKIFG